MDESDRKVSNEDRKEYYGDDIVRQETTAPERRGFSKLYYNPTTQIVMLGFTLFMGPGIFNALNGLGAGGQVDSKNSANANVALYATFAVMAFFAGSINNKLGSRLSLFLGSLGYSIYIGSYLTTDLHSNTGSFVIAAGVLLGVCAGLLWTAHGSLTLAYPTEKQKGRSIAICWSIFSLGAVVGSAAGLGENLNSTARAVGSSTYIGFLVLTLIGTTLPLLMADPRKMYRADGTRVTIPRSISLKVECMSFFYALWKDPMIAFLLPMFWASNWFYTWQFNVYNGALFDIGGRSLNNFVYWTSQIFGATIIGFLLDAKGLPRRNRAFIGWAVLMVMTFMTHIWAYFYQRTYTRESAASAEFKPISIHDKSYAAHIWLYILFGLTDSMWQTTAYWIMGAMSNDPAKLAYFVGVYKSFQRAGGAVAWRLDAIKLSYMSLFISTWVLCAVGLILALPMIYLRVKERTNLAEETVTRMDDSDHVQDVALVEERLGGYIHR